jgi:hypothetical protein
MKNIKNFLKFILNILPIIIILLGVLIPPIWLISSIKNSNVVSHEKVLIDKPYTYAVRLLCIDNKEYIFINGQSSVVLPNNNDNGKIKLCNY